jgi:nucleoside-diphosphate-sugar epimerase
MSSAINTIMVTGGCGFIGVNFIRYLLRETEFAGRIVNVDKLTYAANPASLADIQEEFPDRYRLSRTDICDRDALRRVFEEEGVDSICHFAAESHVDRSIYWPDEFVQTNIIGTYNLMSAARVAGVRRVIYASSIHAVSGYPVDVQVKTSEPVNPGDLYGVSKCFGEALGRYFAEQEGMSVIALRIGAFQPLATAADPGSAGLLDAFVSRRDLNQLIVRCVDDETLLFAIFHGLSNNRYKRLDVSDARALLGYEPRDDLAAENPQFKHTALAEEAETHKGQPHGGR